MRHLIPMLWDQERRLVDGNRRVMQDLQQLNYHHLYYFWCVAHEGSLSRAAEQLQLSRSTLSTQIKALEEQLNTELFLRGGRALSVTPLGHDVLQYADEIFRLGSELAEMLAGKTAPRRARLCLGVVSTLPRTTAYRLAEPALRVKEFGSLRLRYGSLDELLDAMARGAIHLILSDQLPPQGLALHVYSHALGETAVALYGVPELVQQYQGKSPLSLSGAPLLLPSKGSGLRQRLDDWFCTHGVQVQVVGEFDDCETLRMFGLRGHGLFPVQVALAAELAETARVEHLVTLEGVREPFYALSPERRVHRSDLKRILDEARLRLLSPLLRSAGE